MRFLGGLGRESSNHHICFGNLLCGHRQHIVKSKEIYQFILIIKLQSFPDKPTTSWKVRVSEYNSPSRTAPSGIPLDS